MKITMLGHATLLIEVDGKRIITDPWLTDPLYFGQLRHPGRFRSFQELPAIDFVLVSHGHKDHFDPGTLKMIAKKTPVIIFSGYRKTAQKAGFTNIHSLQPGDAYFDGTLDIKALPGKHPGGITTFMIRSREGKVFFGGDSVYSHQLEDSLRDTRPDVCLMPISGGSMGPLKFHMTAKEAAKLVKVSGAKLAIPMHYHFDLKLSLLNRYLFSTNCLNEFQNSMKAIAPEIPYKILDYNEFWEN